MQFLHLYNQSPFKQKRVVWNKINEDADAVDVLKDEKGQKPLAAIDEYKKTLDNRKDKALESMQNSARNVVSRMQETWKHPTAKGAIKHVIDKKVEENLRAKYEKGVTMAERAQQGRLSRIFGISIGKYETITERVNVCNNVISQVEGEIQRAEEMQRLYEQGMAYLRKGIRGKLRYPLVRKVTDPVSYRANKKVLENVREIQADARMKKSEYESRISEKFNDVRKLEDSIRQLVCLYDPSLVGDIDALLEENAFGEGARLKTIVESYLPRLAVHERKALREMVNAHRGKKSKYSKAYEKVGVEVGPEIKDATKMAEAFGQLKIGNRFKLKLKSALESDYTVQKMEDRGGKRILVAVGASGKERIAFNLSDRRYTTQTGTEYKTYSFTEAEYLKITTK
ncbi:MAG: hypothetical protein US89_C0014G0014 [Candidatus Peregrinibacteria bacterium GW2011_GWF2_38_29]|nr:MAG: hypothetical protein US89_C0014G0014 [Candidatus Peregrinibacteria bacterium GW2011_GWF2_38_29]HBB02578.1 hypothetical protein [Candidatus Peregrinibacteria bacterium]